MIRSISGYRRAWARHNKRMAQLRQRPYVFGPAVEEYVAVCRGLDAISDPNKHRNAFRNLLPLEFYLSKIDASFTQEERTSYAQQDRARKPRVLVANNQTMAQLIAEFGLRLENENKLVKALFIDFFKELSALETAPILINEQSVITYEDALGIRRALSNKTFANTLSSVRSKKKSR